MIGPAFIYQEYFNVHTVHGFQKISNRVMKDMMKYLSSLLVQLKDEKLFQAAFTDLIVECMLLNPCRRNI